MDIHENSMPFRFTPDGLDESSINALIAEAYSEAPDAPEYLPAPTAERRPARRRSVRRSAPGEAA